VRALRLDHARTAPPAIRRLARSRDHRVDQHDRARVEWFDDQGCGKSPQRRGDDDDLARRTGRIKHSLRVIRQPLGVVVGWEFHRDRPMPTPGQARCDEMPVPGASASAWDEDVVHARPPAVALPHPCTEPDTGRGVTHDRAALGAQPVVAV
jgi:hypothetical protein